MKKIRRTNRNAWRQIVKQAEQFYGADKVHSGRYALIDAGIFHSLVHPWYLPQRDNCERLILAPRKDAEAFYRDYTGERLPHPLDFLHVPRRERYKFMPMETFPALLKPNPDELAMVGATDRPPAECAVFLTRPPRNGW